MNDTVKMKTLARLGAVLLCTGCAWAGVAPAGSDAGAGGGAQRIYLDPDSGEVIDTPPAAEAQKQRRAGKRGARAWTTEDGVQMLAPDPAGAPVAEAVRCPDGSLRMGHAKAGADESQRQALCSRSTD